MFRWVAMRDARSKEHQRDTRYVNDCLELEHIVTYYHRTVLSYYRAARYSTARPVANHLFALVNVEGVLRGIDYSMFVNKRAISDWKEM